MIRSCTVHVMNMHKNKHYAFVIPVNVCPGSDTAHSTCLQILMWSDLMCTLWKSWLNEHSVDDYYRLYLVILHVRASPSFCDTECKMLAIHTEGCVASVCHQELDVSSSLRLPVHSPCIHRSGVNKRLDNKTSNWFVVDSCYGCLLVFFSNRTPHDVEHEQLTYMSVHSGGYRVFFYSLSFSKVKHGKTW